MTVLGPLVSVLIPVYNGEPYVSEAIASVLAQTYRRLECLVIDDGSTDRTPEIVDRFGASVRFLRKNNGGVAQARNFGAARAEGQYLALLDADDVWRPDKLERQMAVIAADPDVGLVYAGAEIVDEHRRRRGMMIPAPPDVALRNTLLLELPMISLFSGTAVIPVEVFRTLGGFDERLTTSADSDLACRIAARYRVARVDAPLAQYRQHSRQMHRNTRAMEHDMLIVYDKLFGTGVLPADVNRLRDRAYANLYTTVALAHLSGRQWRDGLRCVRRAMHYQRLGPIVRMWTICANHLASKVRHAPAVPTPDDPWARTHTS
jgi:glycosyltransferase involved in cell wall biosynthesis